MVALAGLTVALSGLSSGAGAVSGIFGALGVSLVVQYQQSQVLLVQPYHSLKRSFRW